MNMHRFILVFVLGLLCSSCDVAWGTVTVLNEPFDNDIGFTATSTFFTDSDSDYFVLNNPGSPNIGASNQYFGFVGRFVAVQDTDADTGISFINMTWSGLDITGLDGLQFSALFAEDDSSDGNEDWDPEAAVKVLYSIDGGPEQDLLWFASASDVDSNQKVLEDTDFDGVGDGIELLPQAQLFTKRVNGRGSTLELKVVIEQLVSADADIAFDSFLITGEETSESPSQAPTQAPTLSGNCPLSRCTGLLNRPGVNLYNERLLRCVDRCITSTILANQRLRRGWVCGTCP